MTTAADLAGMDLDAMLKRLHLPTVRRLYAELDVSDFPQLIAGPGVTVAKNDLMRQLT